MGIDLVGKIGSMALIRREEMDMDYNIFARLGRELRPGMVWISSGATEIGRLDFLRRTGREDLIGYGKHCLIRPGKGQSPAAHQQQHRQYPPDQHAFHSSPFLLSLSRMPRCSAMPCGQPLPSKSQDWGTYPVWPQSLSRMYQSSSTTPTT